MKNRFNIAVIAGDGIGKEVMPEGIKVLKKVSEKFDINLNFEEFDFSSFDYYEKHGQMMPDNWKEKISSHDAIFFGAVGWPDKIPDHVSLWGSLLKFRREFDQYVNLRPVKLMPGVPSPLANKNPGDIDFYIVRENTEGEYSSIGGKMFPNTEREFVVQETIMTKIGVDRVLKFAFNLAKQTKRKHLTSATKSNGISITMPYWDERVEEISKNFPEVKFDKYHIDILCAHFVLNPEKFNVVVGSNLFGDILSDLGGGLIGGMGMASCAEIGDNHGLFQPAHGSAPDILGQDKANPLATILSASLMLEYLSDKTSCKSTLLGSRLIETAIEIGFERNELRPIEFGGDMGTKAITETLSDLLKDNEIQKQILS